MFVGELLGVEEVEQFARRSRRTTRTSPSTSRPPATGPCPGSGPGGDRADCAAGGASSAAYQRKNGALRVWARSMKSKTGLHPLAADGQAGVAVAAAAGRVAVGHAVREPAATGTSRPTTCPPRSSDSPSERADAAGSASRRKYLIISCRWARNAGSRWADALVLAGGQGRVVAGDLVLVGILARQDAGQARRAEAGRHITAAKSQALAASRSSRGVRMWG